MALPIESRSRLLFIGDSITDCGRRDDAEAIGQGYVRLIRDYLRAKHPQTAPHVLNLGVSGDTVLDLAARWRNDVLEHAPDVVSILIGVNDVWHRLERVGNGGVAVDRYIEVYAGLLEQMRELRPACAIVLCEPTVILPPSHPRGQSELAAYVDAVHDLAARFGAQATPPLHSAFVAACKFRPDIEWTSDGVHPTSSGHMLIARTWLESTALL